MRPERPALWSHQAAALEFLQDKPRGALFMGMGTGKTRVTVELVKERQAKRVLVLCPKSVTPVWPAQMRKWRGPDRRDILLDLGEGDTTRRAKTLTAALDSGLPLVAAVNFDAMIRGALKTALRRGKWDFVIVDEIHRMRAPGGVQSKWAHILTEEVENLVGLTGTPLPHSPMDAYGIYRVIDERIFGTQYITFLHTYGRPASGLEIRQWMAATKDKGQVTPKDGFWRHERSGQVLYKLQNMEKLNQLMYSVAFRVSDEDLGVPPAVDVERYITLEPKAEKIYRDLEEDLIADVDGGVVTASNALVRLLRLQQVTSGTVKLETGEWVRVSRGKEEALTDFLKHDLPVGEPLVVICRFKADLAAVHSAAQAAKMGSLEHSGSRRELAQWQAGDAQILALQEQSGSLGIDLTRARMAIFYSLSWSLDDYDQVRARIHAYGRRHDGWFLHLVTKGTVDEEIMDALAARRDVVDFVLDTLRRRK